MWGCRTEGVCTKDVTILWVNDFMKDLGKLYTDEWLWKLNTDIGYQEGDLDSYSWGAFKTKASSSLTNIFDHFLWNRQGLFVG